jgi:hypothetical protein
VGPLSIFAKHLGAAYYLNVIYEMMKKRKNNHIVLNLLLSIALTLLSTFIVFILVSYTLIFFLGSPDDGATRYGMGILAAYFSLPIICIVIVVIWVSFNKYRIKHRNPDSEETEKKVWRCPKCNKINSNKTYTCESCTYSLT